MPFSRKSKRNRNAGPSGPPAGSAQLCGLCADGDPTNAGVYTPQTHREQRPQHRQQRARLPKTMTGCTAATATSSSSLYSAASAFVEPDLCPVTGVYADISDDYYVLPDVIGRGHYGVVRECVHLATRRRFAVKSVDKSRVGRLDHLRREICLLANVDHRGIMKMVDCYEDAESVHIITEKYSGGELFDRIVANTDSRGCLPERRAVGIIRSLLEAVEYLHANDIVHRDIKPENVLFESRREDAAVRLIDFGLSRRHAECEAPMSNRVGTAYYMAPELLGGEYDRSCDVWAVGVVAYVMLSGYPPFNGGCDKEIQDATRRGRLRFKGGQWLAKSDESIDFVKRILTRDPKKRLTASEALRHPWIRNAMTL